MDKVVEKWVTTSKPLESRGLWKRFVQERNQILPQAKPSKSISDKYQDYLKAESYLEPKSQMFVRDRMGFDKGGSAQLVEYVNSLDDGTEITRSMIEEYVSKNKIDVNVENFFNRTLKSGKVKDTIKYSVRPRQADIVHKYQPNYWKYADGTYGVRKQTYDKAAKKKIWTLHKFDNKDDADAFFKKTKTDVKEKLKTWKNLVEKKNDWATKFYRDNVNDFKVSEYDQFISKMEKEWASELKSNPGNWADPSGKIRLTDDVGLPLVREMTVFGITSPKKGQVETHGPSKAFYKRAFFKGKLMNDAELRKGLKEYMTWATTRGKGEGRPAAYKATRKDWLKAGESFMDKDTLYFLGEGYDQMRMGQGGGTFYDIMMKAFPKTFPKYHKKVNLNQGDYLKNLKKISDLAGRDFNEVLSNIKKENKAIKNLLGITELPPDMQFGYSGDHLGGIKTALITKNKKMANKVLDNVVASTRGRNTELGYKILEKPKNKLVRKFLKAKPSEKAGIINELNALQQKVDPGTVKWKMTKSGILDFDPLVTEGSTFAKAKSYVNKPGVYKFLQESGFDIASCFKKSVGGVANPDQCIRDKLDTEIKEAKKGNKTSIGKFAKFKNFAKGSLVLDVPLELAFALPHVLMGDSEAAKRATTGGLFGWGEEKLEEVRKSNPEAYKYVKFMKDNADYMESYASAVDAQNNLEALEGLPKNVQEQKKLRYTDQLNRATDKANFIIDNFKGYQENPILESEGKMATQDYFRKDVESKAQQGFMGKDYGKRTIDSLQSFINTKGEPYWGSFLQPGIKNAIEEAGVPNLFDNYIQGADIKDARDLYSELPLKYASELGALEAKETEQGLAAIQAQKEMDQMARQNVFMYPTYSYAGGGIAGVRRPHAIPPKSGPMPQGGGLSSMFNRVRKW